MGRSCKNIFIASYRRLKSEKKNFLLIYGKCRGAIKLHPFNVIASLCLALVPKVCNFISPLNLYPSNSFPLCTISSFLAAYELFDFHYTSISISTYCTIIAKKENLSSYKYMDRNDITDLILFLSI